MKDSNHKPELEKLTSSQFATQSMENKLLDRELVFQELSDKELYEKCRLYGAAARFWRQKFLGLLPEVYKRKLYERKGFGTIFEFAAKLAGVSEKQVSLVLNLEKKFSDKSDLHKALVYGEVSVNKLARVASMANGQNQKILLERAKILPQKALETMVRDLRAQKSDEQLPVLQPPAPEPQLSDEVKQKLCELQQKGIDINEFILEAIAGREQKIAQEKEKLAKIQEQRITKKKEALAEVAEGLALIAKAEIRTADESFAKISRYIPIKIRRLLNQEYGTKCAMPNCRREAAQIHHELPFAMLQSHNPYFLKPLCREHHVIAHGINLAYQHARSKAECAFSFARKKEHSFRSRLLDRSLK